MNSTTLYLDLLKKSLTNTLFQQEPDASADNQATYVQGFLKHYIKGAAVTMLPMSRLDNLQYCVEDVIKRGVPGDIIETGVWRGGATIFVRGILKAYAISDRSVWVADSFEGLPIPDKEEYPIEAKAHAGSVMTKGYNHFAVGIDEVKANFEAYGLLDQQVHFLQGWFKNTLPTAPIERLAVIRLDGDYYESTRDALQNLYYRLSVGGYAIIDDYAEDSWTYCRKAVDEFRVEMRIQDPLIQVDAKCYYWQKTK